MDNPACWNYGNCKLCNCTGRTCPNLYPGHKVSWPELKGTNGLKAKEIIEKDNPFVTAWVVGNDRVFPEINCCNRVIVYVPANQCPDGPVLNKPFVR